MVNKMSEPTVNELVAVIMEFHELTGVDIELLKVFVKKVGDITSDFTMTVMRDIISKGGVEDN